MTGEKGDQIILKSKFLEEKIYIGFPDGTDCDCHELQLKRERVNDSKIPIWWYSVSINGKEISECEFEIIRSLFENKQRIFNSDDEDKSVDL